MNQKYRNKITYLSFLLAILIVVRHSNGIGTYTFHYPSLFFFEQFISDATDIVVTVFFVLSGFLFYQNYEYSKLIAKLKSRFYSLVIPFTIWNLIGFLFYFVLGTIPFVSAHTNNSITEYDSMLGFVNDVFIATKYNGPCWFLLNLIVYTVLTPFVVKVVYNNPTTNSLNSLKFAFLIMLCYGIGFFLHSRLLLCYSTYLFGCYMALNFKKECQTQYRKKIILTAFVLLLATLFAQTLLKLPQSYTLAPLRIVQVILVWISADVFAIVKMPKWWMQLSFFIFLTHHMVLESIEKIVLILLGDTTLGALVDLILAPTLTICLIIMFAYLLRRYSMPIWRVLNGGRG